MSPAKAAAREAAIGELAGAMHTSLDHPYCLTCSARHVPGMPAYTWRCTDCGFGAWSTLLAARHAHSFPDHAVTAAFPRW